MDQNTQNKDAEREFFDKFGPVTAYDVFTKIGYDSILNEFIKFFNPNDPELKAIDFGCGTGAFTSKLAKYPFKKFGIDISKNCIDYAKKQYPDITFSIGDIEQTDFDSNYFDVVFLSGVLHHFSDFSKVLKEAHRILKPGGCVLAYDPHKYNPAMDIDGGVRAGDLSIAMPYRYLKDIMEFVDNLDKMFTGVVDNMLLYGLEAKFYANRPKFMNDKFEVKPNLYFVGDGSGVTRGIIQATAMGMIVGEQL